MTDQTTAIFQRIDDLAKEVKKMNDLAKSARKLTIRVKEAAALLGPSVSVFRLLMKADPRLAACVVRFPGISDPFIHRGRMTEYVNTLAEEQHPYYTAKKNAEVAQEKVQ